MLFRSLSAWVRAASSRLGRRRGRDVPPGCAPSFSFFSGRARPPSALRLNSAVPKPTPITFRRPRLRGRPLPDRYSTVYGTSVNRAVRVIIIKKRPVGKRNVILTNYFSSSYYCKIHLVQACRTPTCCRNGACFGASTLSADCHSLWRPRHP